MISKPTHMRFAVAVLAVSLGMSSFSSGRTLPATPKPAPPGGSLATLLAHARAASGAPYRYHVVSRSRETHDGLTFDVTTETQGQQYLATSCARALCTGFYFDGDRSFDTNFNATPLPLSSAADGLQITLRAIASYAFTDPGFVAQGGTLVEREPVLRDGKTFRRISVAPRFGALLDAIVDPATGLVAGVISDERKYAFEFGDERRIGRGVTLPFAIALNGLTFTTYDARTIVDRPLRAPQGVVPAFANGATALAMTGSDRTALPVVACSVGGHAASCALDTSDSGLSMSLALARTLNLTPAAGAQVVARGGGATVAGIVKGPPLMLGGATYPGANYVVVDNLGSGSYDVVLGADAFARTRVTLDFGRRSVTLAPPEPGDVSGIALAFQNFSPILDVTLDGTIVATQIDTGDPAGLALSRDFATQHPALATGEDAATIASVKIGSLELKNEPVRTSENLGYAARVGDAVLRHFTVTLDYDGDRVIFAPTGGRAQIP